MDAGFEAGSPDNQSTEVRRWGGRHAMKGVVAAAALLGVLGQSAIASAKEPKPKSSTNTLIAAADVAAANVTSGAVVPVTTAVASTGDTAEDLKKESKGKIGDGFATLNTDRPITRSELSSAIGADYLRQFGLTGSGVDVALIDTGIAPRPGLDASGAVVNGPDLSLDAQAGMAASVDAFGHGTHLAGILAGRDGGVAPAARLVNMKVGAADGAVDVSQVIASIDWVVTHRKDPGMNIRVINLAFGTDSVQKYQESPLTHAVESAWRNGIVVVVSAGNDGGALVNPATDPFVITVGSVDLNDPLVVADDQKAPYSAVGTVARRVDLLAPGTSVISTRVPGSMIDTLYPESRVDADQYTKGSGTSQASAVVSGAVAQILQAQPSMTPDQVKALLKDSARRLPNVSSDLQGSGVVDLRAAASYPIRNKTNAAQNFTKSTGTGSIEAARGSSHLAADDGSQLTGAVDVQGAPWVGSTWAPKSTAGTAWTGGTWNGSEWAGTTWSDSNTVDGVTWTARSWRSSTWSARSWRADLWAARSWRSELWAARSWRSGSWS